MFASSISSSSSSLLSQERKREREREVLFFSHSSPLCKSHLAGQVKSAVTRKETYLMTGLIVKLLCLLGTLHAVRVC